jgi:1-acyl-sn-glycerol-3-phosphate acyltransferase
MNVAFFLGFSPRTALHRGVYRASYWLCLGIATMVFRLRVEGREHVPPRGAVIIAANHVSFLDPIVLALAVRRPVCFMAKKELFRFRPFGWLLRCYGVFPVDRGGRDRQALARAVAALQQGEALAIFPEGTRGDGRRLRPAKPGVGLIAARTEAPVVPALIEGTEAVLPRGAWLPRPRRVRVKFGEPLRLAEAGDKLYRGVASFSQGIMERIAALSGRLEVGA